MPKDKDKYNDVYFKCEDCKKEFVVRGATFKKLDNLIVKNIYCPFCASNNTYRCLNDK